MCIIFTCGEHSFRKEVEGYENITCQCHNCGNWSGKVIKTHPWFTFCFVPVIPLSIHGYEEIVCHICNFAQPLANRPDVQQMRGGGGGGGGQGIPMQNQGPPQGWTGGPPPQGGPPNKQQPMRYG